MRTVTLRSRPGAAKRLILFCFVFFVGALLVAIADAATPPQQAQTVRDFWVWNLNTRSYRQVRATLRAGGTRTAVYVEDKLFGHNLSPDFLNRLVWQLETAGPSSAYSTDTGVLQTEEKLFGHLPVPFSQEDRLVILFADLGERDGVPFDGFFNAYDQLSDGESMKLYQRHSNEMNLIYVNGFRESETYTTGVIAHELEHLLTWRSKPRESWLTETLAEGAMLLTGFFGDQAHVEKYVADPGHYPLVTTGTVQFGPQLLFASYLIDTLPASDVTAIGSLGVTDKAGRDAVEQLVVQQTDVPLSFDAIFSNFVSYVFTQSEGAASLPGVWRHSPGIQVPKVNAFYTYRSGMDGLTGFLAPYSFVAVDLDKELSPSAVIALQHVLPPAGVSAASCSTNASVLWKPVNPTRIAIYAVGCDPTDKVEYVQFRLKIVDQPSLLHRGPLNILR